MLMKKKKQQRRMKRKKEEILQDDRFFFIAGYTSGGAPYGVTWEEMGMCFACCSKMKYAGKYVKRINTVTGCSW